MMSVERATAGRAGWRSLLGILLVPLVVAGVLVWALWDPQDRLDTMTAAIVNLDEPVTVEGQLVPLGRQLTAGLVGADEPNYDWVITDADSAADGLADGRFAAVVTIPADFSAAATSPSGTAAAARRATIDVTTSDRSRLVDDALSTAVTSTAADVLGTQLTATYLENVYLGFGTLGDGLADAATGANGLADGAGGLADGIDELASGVSRLAGGADELADGAGQLATGIGRTDDGAGQLADGLAQLAAGARQLPSEADGQALAGGATQVAEGLGALDSALGQQAGGLEQLSTACAGSGAAPEFCAQLAASATGLRTTADGVGQLTGGARTVAGAVGGLGQGLPALRTGIEQSATGAAALAQGTGQLAAGANDLAGGARRLAGGIDDLGGGTGQLADGARQLSDGAVQLSDGLDEAIAQLPRYTESEGRTLAEVVADPVETQGSTSLFGSSGLPYYAALALWLGALATFVALRATPATALGAARSPLALALRSLRPAALVGAGQGVLVAAVLAPQLDGSAGAVLALGGLAALAGVAFAAVVQGLVAAFRGTGRFAAVVVAVVTLATGVVSTTPAALDGLAGLFPTAQAVDGLRGIVTGSGGVWSAAVGLLVWAAAGLAVTTWAIARSRTVRMANLAPTPV
ncbi:YhgE/Pip domain-containing protein [Pseudonocardia lacus]|uniref:YhgE/Pip domain-containing protein n=1 Tax=Pseudonocardia lacus TaxID=2835865 RepID=UPI001BDC7E8F|nr:YhgE/Pip family protein [Pseudonocardia lacus]